MPPVRPTQPTSWPHLEILLTDDGSHTLKDSRLGETYHSGCGALSECLYVYLRNSGIEAKVSQTNANPARVLELGFGTGMGWLLTATAAEAHGARLDYVSLENLLLPVDILQQVDSAAAIDRAVHAGWLPASYTCASKLQTNLFVALAESSNQQPDKLFQLSNANSLRLIEEDALSSIELDLGQFDAIYFDAFSPATSPQLWDAQVFRRFANLLKPDGLLVSYCVSGAVRRALAESGFEVRRLPGPPGGKREVLVAKI